MMKKLYILTILFGLLSCNEENSNVNQDEHNHHKEDNSIEVLFTDVIPENVPDSVKIDIIDQLVSEIDMDSSLTEIKTVDSLEIPLLGFYRNDSLVKILKGYSPHSDFDAQSKFIDRNYTSFYFLMDTLVFSRQECSNYQQTGRCNPVYISVDSYYYNEQIIAEIVHDQIGQYWSCGCGIFPEYIPQKDKSNQINYDMIREMKSILNTANNM